MLLSKSIIITRWQISSLSGTEKE